MFAINLDLKTKLKRKDNMDKLVSDIMNRLDLKRVKLFNGREGSGLNADVYFDKIKTAYAIDSGNGGEMFFRPYDQIKLTELENHIVTLPEIELYPGSGINAGGNPLIGKPDLAWFVDHVLTRNENKKITKNFLTKICVGIPNAPSYLSYNMKMPIDLYPTAQLQKFIDETVKPKMKEGEVILNTNFEELGLKK